MALRTYLPDTMSIILGSALVSNFESITVDYEEDFWAFSTGSGGEVTRTKNTSRLGTITVVLPQSEPVNFDLSALAVSDTPINCGVLDQSGLSVHSMPDASIMRVAPAEYQKTESGTREWIFKGELVLNTVGGNGISEGEGDGIVMESTDETP